MHLSPPAKAPKSQLAVEQPYTGECWNPAKKDITRPKTNRKPQPDDGNHDKIKSYTRWVDDPQTGEQ